MRVAQATLGDPDVRQRDRAPSTSQVPGLSRLAMPRRTSDARHRDRRSPSERDPAERRRRLARGGRPRRRARARGGRARWSRRVARASGPAGTVAWRSRAGSGRNAASSTTTNVGGRVRPRRATGAGRAIARRPQARLDPVDLAADEQRPGIADRSAPGARGSTSSGSASSQPTRRRLLAVPAHPGDRQLDEVGRALEVARRRSRGGSPRRRSPFARTTRLARRCSSGTRRAARPAGGPAGHRRRGGGSDTTAGGRRAGPGTGSRDPAPPASPCRRPGR